MNDTMPDFGAMLGDMTQFLVIIAVAYVYMALCLSMIARKTATPGAGLAWIPVANLVLMARIARRSAIWGLLCLVPIFGLLALILLWMGIAEARGKPKWMGLLIIVPVVNLIVPALLAAGGESPVAPVPDRPLATGCTQCGAALTPGEAFCGECGARLAAPVPPPLPPRVGPRARGAVDTAPGGSGMKAVWVLVGIAALFGAWWMFKPPGAGRAGLVPELPKRLAGTIKEFPVDTAASAPARPTAVISHDLRGDPQSAARKKLPAAWLPPSVTVPRVQPYTESLTAARYQSAGAPGSTYVTVMQTVREEDYQTVAGAALTGAGAGAAQTRTQVQAPSGAGYEGVHVRGGASDVYVLRDLDPRIHIVIVVYSPSQDSRAVAERLTGNIGNGNGLADYPETQDSLAALPSVPPGMSLEGVMDYGADQFFSEPELQAALGGAQMAAQAKESLRQFMPERITVSQYRDAERREYFAYAGDFGGAAKSWWIWSLIRAFSSVAGATTGVAGTNEGITYVDKDTRIWIQRAGPRVVMMVAPAQAPPQNLAALAQGW